MYPSQHQKAINGFQGYFCTWLNTPPPPCTIRKTAMICMCGKVYRTYAYNMILLGSISVAYFIGAIILAIAHTHVHAFI